MATLEDRDSTQLRLQMLEARLKRQRAEIRRLEADAKLHANPFNAIGAAVFILDADYRFLDLNPVAARLLGSTAAELQGQPCCTLMHGTEQLPADCPLKAAAATGEYATGVMYAERIDRHLWGCCTPVFDSLGRLEKLICIADDISAEIQLRDQVAASEKRLRTILNALPDMILETDTAHRIIWANRAALAAAPDAIGKPCFRVADPCATACPGDACVCQSALDTGKMASGIHHLPAGADASAETWWHDVGIPLKNGRGSVKGLIKFSRNVTQDMLAQQGLAASERRFRLLAENSEDVIWTLDPELRLLYVNPAVKNLLGYAPGELIGQPIERVLWPAGNEMARAEVDRFFTLLEAGQRDESPLRMEIAHRCRDGGTVVTEVVVNKFFDQEGNFRFFIGVSRDITERQRREVALRRANKLEAVGVLAGGLAHDFNNLLSVILGNLEMGLADEPSKPRTRYLQAARAATLRSRDLTHQLLAFAKGGDPVRQSSALKPIIEDALARTTIGEGVVPRVIVDPGIERVAVDRLQMGAALRNLLQNAVEAMPDGGELTITAEPHRSSKGDAALILPGNGQRYVKVAIADEGRGISDEVLPLIFDPYFTTKPTGAQKGLGLGLTLAYAVVKRHGGEVSVNSVAGRGTCFTLLLPVGDARVSQAGPRKAPAATQRILLMDDEEQLRLLCEQMLAYLGYSAETVADGGAAVGAYRRAREEGQPFGLVILDLTVKSGMGGKDALRELRRIDPEVLAVVSSGYSEDPVMTDPQRHGFAAVLPKPYALRELTDLLAHTLAEP
jgi:PAS domain S-box-containing protein